MTESTNYKFKLPSSAVGVNDEADIDIISENFSKIDGLLKSTTDKSDTSVQYTEITDTTITLPLDNGIYLVKNDSTVSGANVTISAGSVFSYNGGYQVDGATYNALLTMLKGVISSSGDTFQNIIVSGSNFTGSLVLSYKADDFAGKETVQSALVKKQDTLVSGTNIKTINGNSIVGSGNIEVSGSITVDTELSSSSTNPVQNKAIYNEFRIRTPSQRTSLTFDVAYATPGWYCATGTVSFTNGRLADPTKDYYTSTITNGNSVVFSVSHYNNRVVVQLLHGGYFTWNNNGIRIAMPKDNVLILDYDDNKQLWYSTHYADLATVSETYRKKDEINSNVASTTPTVELNQLSTEQNKDIIYQYANTLTSLTITATSSAGDYLTLDQSVRLIFKATSSTTITVPSGLYFRGDDCNDSYVFVPQDNKVYDIIITYDGFNYNGIVVGTPATR